MNEWIWRFVRNGVVMAFVNKAMKDELLIYGEYCADWWMIVNLDYWWPLYKDVVVVVVVGGGGGGGRCWWTMIMIPMIGPVALVHFSIQ